MARSSGKAPANTSRRYLWLVILIVVAIAGYTGVWFYLAGQLESRSQFLLSDLRSQNVEADCRDLDVRGYPFRLGLHCTSVVAEDQKTATTVSTGGFRSAAQIYKPNHIVSELDGPVSIKASAGLLADMNWDILRSSTVFSLDGLDRASLESKELQAKVTVAGASDPVEVVAETSQFHARRNNADLDAVLRLNSAIVRLGEQLGNMPALDLQADVTLADRASLLNGGSQTDQPWRDLSASLNNLNADLENGAGLSIEGPFSINQDGYLTGKFNMEVRNMRAWQDVLTRAFPHLAKEIGNAAGIAAGIGGGGGSLSLPVNIENGTVRIGFIQLGKLPPI
ncbi:DUF2125 domain-containing protein [Hoeflea prorocentri]|uniref:DUF2125 domain-containing protein n=1 Tax=Hoeflea prorocentri TaxID=1922333 RepID=A0A9X3UMX5_9HYPH|nr:DUF2125 domain-containing protein [Hoeflea prorocentri]MCY6383632.1 DUF2125 domain-containing protein [Hoeflea prorocentri]MDA5401432.1 DUF2125 domain-containing protein [Hoeflea prorocentri]